MARHHPGRRGGGAGQRPRADGLRAARPPTGPGSWQASSQFPAGMTLPRLATDKNGYIPQVPLTSTDLLAQPYATGPLQAAVVDDGPASAAAKAVAAGRADHRPVSGRARSLRAPSASTVANGRRLPVVHGGHALPRLRAPHRRRRRPRALRDVPEQHGRRPRLLRQRLPDPTGRGHRRSRSTCSPSSRPASPVPG